MLAASMALFNHSGIDEVSVYDIKGYFMHKMCNSSFSVIAGKAQPVDASR